MKQKTLKAQKIVRLVAVVADIIVLLLCGWLIIQPSAFDRLYVLVIGLLLVAGLLTGYNRYLEHQLESKHGVAPRKFQILPNKQDFANLGRAIKQKINR